MHLKISQEPLYKEVCRKNAAPLDPRSGTRTSCKPAQSKCTSTFHKRHQKGHFILKFKRKMPRPRLGTESRHTLRASLRNQNACPHVTRDIRRATFYGNLRETSRGPDWAQNDGADVVRACAVEMHVKISQEPLFTEIYRENAAAQIGPRTQTYTLCEPASKCMSTCHKRHQKSHFIRQITGKMPRPRLGPKRRRRRCASLRSRNACQDFTRATFYGNLQGKCRGPDWAQNADIHFV